MTAPDPREILIKAMARPMSAALCRLQVAFDLDDDECALVMLAHAYETDPDVYHAVTALTGAHGQAGLPVWLLNTLFEEPVWPATASAANLRRWHILEPEGPAPRLEMRFRLAEPVTDALSGIYGLDPALDAILGTIQYPERLPAPEEAEFIAEALRLETKEGLSPVILVPSRIGVDSVAALLHGLMLRPYRIETARLAARVEEVVNLQRRYERDSSMRPSVLVAEVPGDLLQQEALSGFVNDLAGHVVLVGEGSPAGLRRAVHRLEAAQFRTEDPISLWRSELGEDASRRLNGSLELAASHFELDAAAIVQTARAVRDPVRGAASAKDAALLFWNAAARAAWPEPGNLARIIEPRATFDDLVVTQELHEELKAIVRQIRHAGTVFNAWKFDRHGARGRGTIALFSGPSGTGKTLAAEVIAHALSLPLVIADFSQLQSKWVGETPKLAAQLFDDLDRGGAVLLIDEAEGLLGQRGAVTDAHDRHANAEIGYFLQRLEAFRGLAILTTNMKQAIDSAFMRRFRFALHFSPPDFGERVELWTRAFPPSAPVGALDRQALARFNLTGGAIRNIALNAAFLAAEEGSDIERRHVARALRTEYRKLERPLSELEVGGFA